MYKLYPEIQYSFIDTNSKLYNDSIQLRYIELFKPTNKAKTSVIDNFEEYSYKLVAHIDDTVVGHARLYTTNSIGEISQVVVHKDFRGLNIGRNLMYKLMLQATQLNLSKLLLDSRTNAIDFYKHLNFQTISNIYISPKSDMPIIKMENTTFQNIKSIKKVQ